MCLGKALDKATGQEIQLGKLSAWAPTAGEALDPHYMRTNSKAEERHTKIGVHKYDSGDVPEPPKMPATPQATKPPDPTYLNRRNKPGSSMGNGQSTLLTSPSGLGEPLTGRTTLLGGG